MLKEYLERQNEWSKRTFPHKTPLTIIKHIEKELAEIREHPTDLIEWIDVIILAFDGAWQAGYTPEQIVFALQQKQSVNFGRRWQKPVSPNEPIEHVREEP